MANGYVDKDGKKLRLNFYTYTSRPEVTLYAEALQVDYKKIGRCKCGGCRL